MTRLILAAGVIASFLFLAIHAAAVPTASAQQPDVCLNLPAGEHQFRAEARDRAGQVSFRVEVGEGGRIIEFYEPGGQPVGTGAFLQVFTGPEAYALPDGVEIVDCGADASGGGDDAAGGIAYCTALEPGSYTETISAGGRSYEATLNVGAGGRLIDIQVLGQTYGAHEAIQLFQGFGAALPEHLGIGPCEAAPAAKPDSGNAGLAGGGGASTLGYVAAAIAALAVGGLSVAVRRRIGVRA